MFIFFLYSFIFTIVFSTNVFAEEQYDDIKIGNITNYHILNNTSISKKLKMFLTHIHSQEILMIILTNKSKKLLKRYQEINKKM